MLEYIRLLIQGIKIEEGQILQAKLMNMVNNLATVQGELVGDPNYNKDDKSLEEAFRNITTILIADAARLEYSEMPDNDRMIFEARDMAEMFNNLLFENLTKHDVKEAFEKAWAAL
jgi:flagellar biosynthesis component FlhA